MSTRLQVTPSVTERLGRPQQLFINGEFVDAVDGRTFDTVDPSTGKVLATVAWAGSSDVDAAVAAARAALAPQGAWSRSSSAARGRMIARLADLIEREADGLAQLESLDNGKPFKFASRVDLPQTVAHFRYFAGATTGIEGKTFSVASRDTFAYTRPEPVGVCGLIVPWNFPLLIASWKIAPALAAGCTLVLKPAEQTPLSALWLAELAREAGIPPGVLNVLTGDGSTGQLLVAHGDVDKVSFTGSTAVGREIGARAGRDLKRVTLELGGKSPNIILPDADLGAAIKGSFSGLYFNSGQACNAASRLFVPRVHFDHVVESLADMAKTTTIGAGLDPETFVGPVVSHEQHQRVSDYIEQGRREAQLIAGGNTAFSEGYFIEPTLFVAESDEATIVREEIFGPVLVAQVYDSLEEVATRANDTEYGLAAGVWTRDISIAHRLAAMLRAGTVYINTWGVDDAGVPFGGFKSSGIGREHGREGLEAYLETKAVFAQL